MCSVEYNIRIKHQCNSGRYVTFIMQDVYQLENAVRHLINI